MIISPRRFDLSCPSTLFQFLRLLELLSSFAQFKNVIVICVCGLGCGYKSVPGPECKLSFIFATQERNGIICLPPKHYVEVCTFFALF